MQFRPNARGIDEVLRSREVADMLDDAAEEIAEEIRRNAPSGFHDYADSVDTERAARGISGELEAAVVVDSPGWHLVEYGTVEHAPRATIARAARSVVRDFRET